MAIDDKAYWARAKVERARDLSHQLQASIQEWTSAMPSGPAATIAQDRLSYEVRLPGDLPDPPYDQWSLILGDSLHNLRSALDTLVWAHVDEAALTAKQARGITFPICQDAAQWKNMAARQLLSVPPPIVDRIAEVQPMHAEASARAANLLVILHSLDIRDKHRLSVRAAASPINFEVDGSVEFESPEAAANNQPPDVTVHAPELQAGALLLTYRAKDPIASAGGRIGMHFQATVSPLEDGEPAGVLQLLGGLGNHVLQVIDHVTTPAVDQ